MKGNYMSQEPCYGLPCVQNPNDFIPDAESCTDEEIAAHKKACADWGKPEFEPNKGCYDKFDENGNLVLHVTRTSWGIGTNLVSVCDECREPFGNLLTCHECGPEFCEICWPIHERKHDDGLKTEARMADLGRWFKLWCASTGDPDLSCLPIADFGRWCKFGTYTKEHGTDGKVVITMPSYPVVHRLQTDFQVESFDAVLCTIKSFPNMQITSVSSETNVIVSISIEWGNWAKYQGDFSSERVRRHRAKIGQSVTAKKRGEEKRRDKMRGDEKRDTPIPPKADERFDEFWKEYPKKVGKGAAENSWNKIRPSHELYETILHALSEQKKSAQWTKDKGQYIPLPSTWLNQKRWGDDLSTIQDDEDVDPIWTRNLTIAK